jgi:dipeptidyl aminopeptidase/acylaminoacyl peptidase
MHFTRTKSWCLGAVLLVLTALSLHAQTNTPSIQATDLTRIKQLGAVYVAPDGKKAVYAVTSIEPDADNPQEYKYISQLHLTDFTPGASQVLTRGPESIRQPAWSPDSRAVAFVRTVKGKPQVFVLSLGGGEAWQLTNHRYGAASPKWSPDGKRILFAASLSFPELLKDSLLNPGRAVPAWSLEKPGFRQNEQVKAGEKNAPKANPDGTLEEVRAYLQKNVEDKKARVVNRLNLQGEATVEPEPEFSHLYVVDVREGAPPRPLTKGFYAYTDGYWMPDGRRILFAGAGDSTLHPDRDLESRVYTMNADGTGRKTLLADKGVQYAGFALSPDGKTLAFIRSPVGMSRPELGFLTLADGKTTLVDHDRPVTTPGWTPDGKYLYFISPSNGGFPLYRVPGGGRTVERLTDFESGVAAFALGRDKVVFAKTEVANPYELYVADLSIRKPTKLTGHNEAWLAGKKLSFPEKHTLTNSAGQTVEYWIMKPADFKEGRKYPLLLQMHGGPTAMWGPGEASMWHEFQFFAAKGYGIVYANPRGSGGYGFDFLRANYQDWGDGPASDVLAAATEAARAAWVDTSRQVITGGSYAGYLTAWIIAHDHRFKAAFAQRGVYDLTTFMGEANAWRLVPNYFGGYPWQDDIKKVLDANSPLTYVDQIRTPLLIKHGENDLRTGVSQSEMLYKSLKVLGREVEYVRVPGATHELSRTGNVRQRLDRLLRIYEFMERYVGEPKATAK